MGILGLHARLVVSVLRRETHPGRSDSGHLQVSP